MILVFTNEQKIRFNKLLSKIKLDLLDCNYYVAGGTLRRIYLNQEDNDIDVFFASKEDLEIAKAYYNKLGFNGEINKIETNITYNINDLKVQFIYINYYPIYKDLIYSFDFTLCQAVFDKKANEFYITESCINAWNKRIIEVCVISYAVSSIRRIIKYTQQGFYICPDQIKLLLDQVVTDPTKINHKIVSID